MDKKYEWTDGSNETFEKFHKITEEYYNQIVGGAQNRATFVPYNEITDIKDVLIVYNEKGTPMGCASFKQYSAEDAEIKRVWVEPEFRGNHIAYDMIEKIENRAKEKGYKRAILQTRKSMKDAVGLYQRLGYCQIENYPPYNTLDNAICFAKELV